MTLYNFPDPHSGKRKGIWKRGKSVSGFKSRKRMYEEWKTSGAQFSLTFQEYIDKMEPFKKKKNKRKKK